MSISIMTEAWKVETSPTEKFTLLALADYANDQGLAWPAIGSLASKTSSSPRTVQRSIRALEREGHITCEQIPGRSCRYHVHPRHNDTPANVSPLTDCQGTPVTVSGDPRQDDTRPCQDDTQTNIETSLNHQEPSFELEAVADATSAFSPDHVMEGWNELAGRIGKPTIRGLNPARRKSLISLIARHTIEDFQEVFEKIERSAFLRGDTGSHFLAFDWMIKPANFQKILEGNYSRGPVDRDLRDGFQKALDEKIFGRRGLRREDVNRSLAALDREIPF